MAKFRITLTINESYRPEIQKYDAWVDSYSWLRISNVDYPTLGEAKDFIERYKQKGKVVWEGE